MSMKVSSLSLGISWILRVGVTVSLVLESAGVLLDYIQTGNSSLDLSAVWQFKGGNFFDFTASTIRALGATPSPLNIMSLGVMTLMLTPYARVVAGVIYYGVQKDWKYVGITLFVLAVITTGLVVL
jgi:uncharacterized membrane protein